MATTQFHIRQANSYYNHNIQTFASVVSLFEQSCSARSSTSTKTRLVGRAAGSSFVATRNNIPRSRSCEMIIPEEPRRRPLLRRVYNSTAGGSADHDHGFSEEEFLQHLQELAHLNFNNPAQQSQFDTSINQSRVKTQNYYESGVNFSPVSIAPAWTDFRPPHFPLTEESHVPASVNMNEFKGAAAAAHSLTRMIEKKKKIRKREREEEVPKGKYSAAGLVISESAHVCCSVKKAFSSMVFMIRELQSYILQIREQLFLEDLRGIVTNVQNEIQASFVWLFQQVFSCTPTLMVYVMILLANFTVYSMDHNAALAAAAPPPATVTLIEIKNTTTASTPAAHSSTDQSIEPSRKFSIPASSNSLFSGKNNNILSIGGGSGGAGKSIPVAGGTDGSSSGDQINVFDPFSSISSSTAVSGGDHDHHQVTRDLSKAEGVLWNSVTEEAAKMKAEVRGMCLNDETVRQFVSPEVAIPVEEEEEVAPVAEYFKRELVYQDALAQEPNNSLLLSNYAQFLFLVVHDHDRAEEYFKRAAVAEPIDAEALNRYAKFLWIAKNDMNGAEETFLEALAIEPGNAYYAGDYASFLWKTGGEDTCFPLDAPNSSPIMITCRLSNGT